VPRRTTPQPMVRPLYWTLAQNPRPRRRCAATMLFDWTSCHSLGLGALARLKAGWTEATIAEGGTIVLLRNLRELICLLA
jgi:hypothetical protein